MNELTLQKDTLTLYKSLPAIVRSVGDKFDIELPDGKSKKVRAKDLIALHPGPLKTLGDLTKPEGNLDEALELIEGEATPLDELAELIYGDYTPASAWACWQLLSEGLYFEGDMTAMQPRDATEVAAIVAEREATEAKAAAWNEMLARFTKGVTLDEDKQALSEVERVALGKLGASKILKALKIEATPEKAHQLLLKLAYWPEHYNPWPARGDLALVDPDLAVPDLPDEMRVDLTHLYSWAIDDEGNQDPDDAVAIENGRIWVHVADVAALVALDSDLDLEARSRIGNSYLPEHTIHMLPTAITKQLGLGLSETSPALSFSFELDDSGAPINFKAEIATVKVKRATYAEVTDKITKSPFAELNAVAKKYRERRIAAGSIELDLPEVSTSAVDGEVIFKEIRRGGSRQMITELMLMAGEAVAMWAQEHNVAIAYATQPPTEEEQVLEPGIVASYQFRRFMKPSRSQQACDAHFGLGLPAYVRVTSPLRRYLDLVAHQQIRTFIKGEAVLDSEAITLRIAANDLLTRSIRRAERESNQHWKILHLNKYGWEGEGLVVDMREDRITLMIAEMAVEARLRVKNSLALGDVLKLKYLNGNVTDQFVRFAIQD